MQSQFRDYKTNSILWSLAYHASLYFSAFLAVLATLVLKMDTWPKNWDDKKRKDNAAALAAFSAFLITVSTAGDFQGKWQASRLAATQTASIAFDLLKEEENIPVDIVSKLQSIFVDQNLAVIGEGSRPDAAGAKKPEGKKPLDPVSK